MNNNIKEFYDIAVEETSDLICRIKEHPFNTALMNGTLDSEKFKFYLQQDFLYLVDCTRALLIIAAKSEDVEIMSGLMNAAVEAFKIRELYKKNFEDTSLSDCYVKSKSCAAFTNFFMRAAYHNSFAVGLAASYPCYNIYQIVTRSMISNLTSEDIESNKYKAWIEIYNSKEMNTQIDNFTKVINMQYNKSSNNEKKTMREFFRQGVELEVAFWDEMNNYKQEENKQIVSYSYGVM